jgi:hypothetical protein
VKLPSLNRLKKGGRERLPEVVLSTPAAEPYQGPSIERLPVRALGEGLAKRRCMFPDYAVRRYPSAKAFHMPQHDKGTAPIPPMPFELIDQAREGRHQRRAAARRRHREVCASAHAIRVLRMKAARAAY